MGRSLPSIVISRITNDATMPRCVYPPHNPNHEATAFQGWMRSRQTGTGWPAACLDAERPHRRRPPVTVDAGLVTSARTEALSGMGRYQPYEEVWRVQADDDRSGERTG